MILTSKNYKKLMWLALVLIPLTALINPVEIGLLLGVSAIFCFAMGMSYENKNK